VRLNSVCSVHQTLRLTPAIEAGIPPTSDRDGNTRIGFLALVTFLGINGVAFDAPEQEVVAEMVMLAVGKRSKSGK
jgi:hypothetical protein